MKFLATLSLLALATVSSQAADLKFGIHGGLSLPQGKVADKGHLDSKMGFTLGASLQVDLGKGHAVVPRLDLSSFSRSQDGDDYNVTHTTLGLDYNYFVNGKANEGFYVIGGLGFAQVKHEYKMDSLSISDSPTAIQFAAGAGYHFSTNLHTELRYTSVTVERKFSFGNISEKETIECPGINLTVGYRF